MLATGQHVPKDSLRIETYGTVDELNSFLGWLRDTLRSANKSELNDLIEQLGRIQNEMHDLGGELATPVEHLRLDRQQVITAACISKLEEEIDSYNESLQPLANFVIPGGHQANSLAHVCRTVCRRAERLIVSLDGTEKLRDEPRIYLNRLSDWLFVASRKISQILNVPEVLWRQAGKS